MINTVVLAQPLAEGLINTVVLAQPLAEGLIKTVVLPHPLAEGWGKTVDFRAFYNMVFLIMIFLYNK